MDRKTAECTVAVGLIMLAGYAILKNMPGLALCLALGSCMLVA